MHARRSATTYRSWFQAWFLGCLLAVLVFGSGPAAGADGDPLIGIWMYRTAMVPGLHGELTVTRKGESWRARLSGAEARFVVNGNEVRFSFPGGQGSFRGALSGAGPGGAPRAVPDAVIDGFWLRPGGASYDPDDPGGSGEPFATPLVINRSGGDAWRATVRPLEDGFTLYLKITRGADGALVAAFRNPEMNSTGGASLHRISRDGDKVRISHKPSPDAPEVVLEATLARSPDRLRLRWPELGRAIELTRATPAQAAAFFPQPPGTPKYTYRRPPVTGDGWATARAGEIGLDEAALARMVQQLIDGDPASRRPSLIHSMLVARQGKLVLEEYFFGFDRDTPHDLRSAGKTFSSVMLGAAMLRGTHIGPDSKVAELLAGLGPFAHPDPRKSQITLAHLMTHTAGLACDDNDDASPGREDLLWRQRDASFWKYTLDLPIKYDPGVHYAYCSANMNLVGGALTTATGTWLPELFDRTIARPLQFDRYHWNVDWRGEGYLGGGAYVRPRDLLKLGQAYLDGGVWRGQRIVDATWVTRSTAPVIEISPATTGLDPEVFQNFYGKDADGYARDAYAWHLGDVHAGTKRYRAFNAGGNGGQLLFVIPELELVVVFTGGNYLQGGIWSRWRDDIIGAQLVAAIRR
jgi:CubicO group peptidase (beta-lactamase class C family)